MNRLELADKLRQKLSILGMKQIKVTPYAITYKDNSRDSRLTLIRIVDENGVLKTYTSSGYSSVKCYKHFILANCMDRLDLFVYDKEKSLTSRYTSVGAFFPYRTTKNNIFVSEFYSQSEVMLVMYKTGMVLVNKNGDKLKLPDYPLNASYNLLYNDTSNTYTLVFEECTGKGLHDAELVQTDPNFGTVKVIVPLKDVV